MDEGVFFDGFHKAGRSNGWESVSRTSLISGRVHSHPGDIIANGFTMLEWRKKIVDYSIPTFPTQVWIMARENSSVSPINPAGEIEQDILMVKDRLSGPCEDAKKTAV